MITENIEIKLLENSLDEQDCLNFAKSDEAGGLVLFVGTVRNQTKGRKVIRLEFEAYDAMAIKEMYAIASEAIRRFSLSKAVIHHRVGVLSVGEIPVLIAASSAHRGTAFQACEFMIDTLKETVPIWKKEFFEDGEIWVSATP